MENNTFRQQALAWLWRRRNVFQRLNGFNSNRVNRGGCNLQGRGAASACSSVASSSTGNLDDHILFRRSPLLSVRQAIEIVRDKPLNAS